MAGKLKIPPLLLAVAAGSAQRLVARHGGRPGAVRAVAAGAVSVASAGFLASSVREFRRSQTTVNPMTPEQVTSLVTSGPHQISRNPGTVKTRVLAWVLHPRDAKEIVIPVPKK